jgi:hypothetical protein
MHLINFFNVGKYGIVMNLNTSMLTFQSINKSYRPFLSNNFLKQKVRTKLYIVQVPDPDLFFSGIGSGFFFRGRIRILIKIVLIRNTAIIIK